MYVAWIHVSVDACSSRKVTAIWYANVLALSIHMITISFQLQQRCDIAIISDYNVSDWIDIFCCSDSKYWPKMTRFKFFIGMGFWSSKHIWKWVNVLLRNQENHCELYGRCFYIKLQTIKSNFFNLIRGVIFGP